MNKMWNFGKTGIVAVFCLLVTLLFSSCEETFIHADRAMPGVWVIDDIYDISPEGLVDMPFRIGDEVEFMDDGCFFYMMAAMNMMATGGWKSTLMLLISVSKWRAIEIQSEDVSVMCMPDGWFGRFILII